jgi:putative membrane protein
MMWGYNNGMGWWMVFGMVWSVIFWVIVIGLVVWAVTRISTRKEESPKGTDTPLEIAKKRLARGEITQAEFEDLKKALQ